MPRRPDMPPLDRSALAEDPIEQFREWYERAAEEVPLADAMTLATVDADGAPDARMVLLKGFGPDGFRFFTSYESAKGAQLAAHASAALVVYWRELDRQVRVRGLVERLNEADSDAYFSTRPRDSRLGAWASPQSRVLPDRASLDERLREVARRYPESDEVPRPEHWGGFALQHEVVEFWQGQQARLHDRFRYRREDGGWLIERLGPWRYLLPLHRTSREQEGRARMLEEKSQIDYANLHSELAGEVVTPADEGWDVARQAWNLAVDQRPEAVVIPANADDVAATVRFAAASGVRVAPQGTGHNARPLGDL